jgi:NAD(P) transhydrogenase subunit alpha
LKGLFSNINMIVRAKRPNQSREQLEVKLIAPETIMIGALDPFEKHSQHVESYKTRGIHSYSIDQLDLPADNPMNILASMSGIAGKLALQDVLNKTTIKNPQRCIIIGAGTAGMAAIDEALAHQLEVTVVLTSSSKGKRIVEKGGEFVVLDKGASLTDQQAHIKKILHDADVVVASARRPKENAPLLIPASTLETMKQGACIVDLAISEGGNVEGSEHDKTVVLGNKVVVTNVSGYPKVQPRLSSIKWSKASLAFIELLSIDQNNKICQSVKIS